MQNTPYTYERGYALLIAVMIGGFLSVLAIAIFNITSKEVRLSSTARESQIAIYAADTGLECALYWDFKYGVFPAPQTAFATSSSYTGAPNGSGISCVSDDISIGPGTVWSKVTAVDAATTTFTLNLGPSLSDPCVFVTVAKVPHPSLPPGSKVSLTKIESRGRNSCDPTNTRRVERALRASF